MNRQPPPVPAPPPFPAESQAKQGFSILWWGWAALALGSLAVIPLAWQQRAGRPEFAVSYVVGTLIGMLLISIIPALIAFYISRRSQLVATITFVVLIVLGVLGQVGTVQRNSTQRKTLQALDSQIADVQATVRQQLESPEGADPDKLMAAVDTLATNANQAAGSLNGQDAAQLRALSAFLRRLSQQMEPYNRAATAMQEKSPLQPDWVVEKKDLDEARARIHAFQKCNEDMSTFYSTIELVLKQEMQKENLSQEVQRQTLAGFNSKMVNARPKFASIRRQDAELSGELLKACSLLSNNWGGWRYDPDTQTVVIERDDVLAEFNRIHERVLKLADEQARAQREYAEAMR